LPTRLLDVQSPSSVHLVISDDGIDSDWGYAALSYCWGDSMPASGRTTRSTLAAHLQQIDVEQLPKTLREAIEVTRSLSIKYLWIDALCIIQDDEADREHEIESMAEVYSCATVTIAAGVSIHCNGGFLVANRPRLRFPKSPITYRPEIVSAVTCPWIDTFFSNPLFQRGWTLQERELSPRVLHFTSTDVVFECRQGIRRYELATTEPDSKPVEQSYLFFAEPGGWRHRILDLQDSRKKFLRTDALTKIDSLDWHVVWWRTVEEYSKRRFTDPSDRLRAIAGLADTLQKKFKWNYATGLWTGNMVLDLLWRAKYIIDPALAESYLAPSWSWASV
ncbi:HET-domain-containing protein, partial [Stipitochalara longipes BDJ]